MGVSSEETETLFYVRIGTSIISLSGAWFIMLAYALFAELRGFTFRLIFMLQLADALYSIGFLIPNFGIFCTV